MSKFVEAKYQMYKSARYISAACSAELISGKTCSLQAFQNERPANRGSAVLGRLQDCHRIPAAQPTMQGQLELAELASV
jgi:hypothetical protein